MEEKIRHAGTALGTPIDDDVMNTVIMLKLLGIKPGALCEGCLDYGRAYPWGDSGIVISEEVAGLLNEIEKI